MKTKPTYTIKKIDEGDYEVTLHNQTRTFQLKDLIMDLQRSEKSIKEAEAQERLDKAVLQNVNDHHKGVVDYFKKLPKVEQVALANHIQITQKGKEHKKLLKTLRQERDKIVETLDIIHPLVEAEENKKK